ncbi:MAG: hypothetical protein A4E31_00378 [Methanomassiliicoccales archaeon PtaU1.Bin030]|nr:MAG: hypothetical protein A4E31_00378 [Methanomassiliicoccales archaeon PtaU1.Bin030]
MVTTSPSLRAKSCQAVNSTLPVSSAMMPANIAFLPVGVSTSRLFMVRMRAVRVTLFMFSLSSETLATMGAEYPPTSGTVTPSGTFTSSCGLSSTTARLPR